MLPSHILIIIVIIIVIIVMIISVMIINENIEMMMVMTTTSVSDPCRQTLYSSRHFVNLGSPSNFLSMADLSLDDYIDEVRELTELPNNNCFIRSQYHRALMRACPK